MPPQGDAALRESEQVNRARLEELRRRQQEQPPARGPATQPPRN
jgi:hypothetical protein